MTEHTETYPYEPETAKYVYGKTDRWPCEKLFAKRVNDVRRTHPDFELKLIGTSGVHGEMFPLYFTQCEFKLPDANSLAQCLVALKTSDELIRRRVNALWDWDSVWINRQDMLFFVRWFDFAYFMKNKELFLAKDHSRLALDFGLDVQEMRFQHYKIFRDGSWAPFDVAKITAGEEEVLAHLDEINFSREFAPPRF